MLLHDIWEKTTFEIRHMQKYPHFYSFLMLGVSTYMPIFFHALKPLSPSLIYRIPALLYNIQVQRNEKRDMFQCLTHFNLIHFNLLK